MHQHKKAIAIILFVISILQVTFPLSAFAAKDDLMKLLDDIGASNEWARKAAEQLDKGSYDNAILLSNKAISIYPQNTYAYITRGKSYHKKKLYEHALSDFNISITINPQDKFAYIARGFLYQDQYQYAPAIKDFTKAIEIDPRDPLAYITRCLLYADMQVYDLAIKDCDTALEIDPQYHFAYFVKGAVYEKAQRPKESINAFLKYLDNAPANDKEIPFVKDKIKQLLSQI